MNVLYIWLCSVFSRGKSSHPRLKNVGILNTYIPGVVIVIVDTPCFYAFHTHLLYYLTFGILFMLKYFKFKITFKIQIMD